MFNRNEITSDAPPTRAMHPWHQLEENFPNGGMWSICGNALARHNFARMAAELMVDTPAFTAAMRRALKEWPRSCAQAFTTPGLNQRAWIGHAGCYIATGSPEEVTRIGWHDLDHAEQYAANAAADHVIAEWRAANRPVPDQPSMFGEFHA